MRIKMIFLLSMCDLYVCMLINYIMFVLVCLVLFVGSTCMSMDKIIGLFNSTYDVNGDGESDIGEFAQYYTWL
jgi:hypothetical protein